MTVSLYDPGQPEADELGFTTDRFDGWIGITDDQEPAVYLSFVVSKQPRQGHLRAVCDAILARGLAVKIPTPLDDMLAFMERVGGFERTIEHAAEWDNVPVEVWIKRPA